MESLKRNKKRAICAFIAGTMIVSMSISNVFGNNQNITLHRNSGVQMSSDPEVIYYNSFNGTERTSDFNDNWKFYLGDSQSASNPNFDDSKWRIVQLPHDYSIEQDYSKSMEAESGYKAGGIGWYRKTFTVDAAQEGNRIRIDFGGVYMNSTVWVNGQKLGTHPYGYTPFSFDITDYVKFGQENVISVKVDHKTPSSRWYSGSGIYRGVNLTITNPVSVDLYGTKIETKKLEQQQNGTVEMDVKTTVTNSSKETKQVVLTHTVFPKNGTVDQKIGTVTTNETSINAGSSADITAKLNAVSPKLWSVENPNLYVVRTEVKIDNKIVDTYDTDYGFRYFNFDSNTGFYLNGEKVKLKGVCMHHDQGALGSEAWYRATERQIEILKEMGCNSIRVTHNPASYELIEICNKKGMLVVEEAFDGWDKSKNGNSEDYAKWFNTQIEDGNKILGAKENMTWAEFDLTAMVKRGQNDPSIIMWCTGNEVMEGIGGSVEHFPDTANKLIEWIKQLDTTRPATIGDNKLKANWQVSATIGNSLTNAGGTVGFNYCDGSLYDSWHQKQPTWKMYGSETASAINSRGIYHRITGGQVTDDKQLTSYDNSAVGWGAVASSAWYDVITRDFVAGEYVWTGFDYLGEPTPWNKIDSGAYGSWPSPKSSYFGIVDTAGFPKDSYYFYQSQWNDDVNTLHLLPAWNSDVVYKDGQGKVPVVVYSDAHSVELFFTPKGSTTEQSLGKKTFTQKTTNAGYKYQIYEGEGANQTKHKNLYLTWNVTYADGTIRAVAYDETGKEISETKGRKTVTTTSEPAKLKISVDRNEIKADGDDLSYITVDVLDKDGNIVPNANNRVTFKVEGEGSLVGVDNGSSPDHDSFLDDNREAFSGKVLGIVQSTEKSGEIKVTVSADGLTSDVVTLTTTGGSDGDKKVVESYTMPKNFYVKTNNMPQLPSTIEVKYSDGTTSNNNVTWDTISQEQIKNDNSFIVNGKTSDNLSVSVNVNMISKIGAVQNYSTTTQKGQKPILPDSRPMISTSGEILGVSFPVTWDNENNDYNTPGIVTVQGKANVFNEEIPVISTIRVQEEQISVGDNIAPSALRLSQDIDPANQSDTLKSIIDGSTTVSDNNGGGANPTIWSNWQNSKLGDNKAELTFEYATQQRINQMVIHFVKDANSIRYPQANTTEIYISDDGSEGSWKKVEVNEAIGNESNRVKPYTYTFAPVSATFVKICITNSTETTPSNVTCTGISEVVINQAVGQFITNSTAELEKLVVNGKTLSADILKSGGYSTPELVVDSIEYKGKDNASVTYVEPLNDVAKLIIESEDHSNRNEFTINLNQEVADVPSDSSRDYPVENLTASAGSEHATSGVEGPAKNALDGDLNTLWHTNWSNIPPITDLWIQFELAEATKLDAVRYYARNGSHNGRIKDYKVEISDTGEDNSWTTVSTGTWENEQGWKLAKFTEPKIAKFVRLTALHTYGDQTDKYASAAEIRLRKAVDTIDISSATVKVTPEVVTKPIVDENNPAIPDSVEVTLNGTTLKYGIDYKLSYTNNTTVGTATVTITGMQKYTGTVEKTYEIKLNEKELTNISIKTSPQQTAYTVGQTFNPQGLVISAMYNDGTTTDIAYNNDTANEFTFNPDTNKPLTLQDRVITVTYQNKQAEILITVNEEQISSISVAKQPTKTSYTVGELFDPTGLVLNVNDNTRAIVQVAYTAENAHEFAFNPALDQPLTLNDKQITVTYKNQTTTIPISISSGNNGNEKPPVNPENPQQPTNPDNQQNNNNQNNSPITNTGDKLNYLLISLVMTSTVSLFVVLRKKISK